MNLPVSPASPDSSSFTASAATKSSFGAKDGWNTSSTASGDSNATSFDDVFSKVGEDAPVATTSSPSSKSSTKTGKGSAPCSSASGQSNPSQADTSSTDAGKTSPIGRDSGTAQANTAKDGTATDLPGKEQSHGKHDTHGDEKKSSVAPLPSASLAITAEQIAAALAASLTSAVAAQPSDATASTSDGTGRTSTLTLKNGKGRSVTDLLAQGAPVLNFDASQTKSGGAKPVGLQATAEDGAPAAAAQTERAAGKTSVTKAAADKATQSDSHTTVESADRMEKKQAVAETSKLSPVDSTPSEQASKAAPSSGKPDVSTKPAPADSAGFPKPLSGAQGSAEKFADTGGRQEASGDDSSNRSAKNTILVSDNKQLKSSSLKVGTDTAIGSAPMMSNLHASANNAASSDVLATASSSAASTTSDVHATASSHAAALVHQINDIGEGLWRVDRQSVEVNFNFGDKDHLSVRVEYKNGQVQATFATSSTELRTAITQAWNSQNSSDNRSYKMADPVFTSSSNSSFSSSEDSSSQSRQFSSFQDASTFAGAASRSRSSSQTVSAASASTSSRASLRPEVAGHLNAIV